MEIVVQLHQLPSLRGDPTLVGEQGIISRKLVYLRPFIPFKSTILDANGNSLSLKLDAHSTLLQSTGNGCSRLIPISICTVMLPDETKSSNAVIEKSTALVTLLTPATTSCQLLIAQVPYQDFCGRPECMKQSSSANRGRMAPSFLC